MLQHWLRSLPMVAVLAAAPASAAILDAKFTGTVTLQTGSAYSVGNAISGEFRYDTALATYTLFTIGGVTVSPPYSASASLTPDRFSAFYQENASAVQQGGTVNNSLTLDLEGINQFTSANAVALLTDASQIPGNIDFAASTFNYRLAGAAGNSLNTVTASLSTFNVTAVPEPATMALLASACVGVVVRRRRA